MISTILLGMASSHITFTYHLSLVQSAKRTGGDKYSMQLSKSSLPEGHSSITDTKTSFIYVSQAISRVGATTPVNSLTMVVTNNSVENTQGWLSFECIKLAKTVINDDRYTPKGVACETWTGDVYLPRSLGGKINSLIHITFH
jgi:hypothetical protein